MRLGSNTTAIMITTVNKTRQERQTSDFKTVSRTCVVQTLAILIETNETQIMKNLL